MARKYQVISADGHVEVPVDMWAHRVPAKYRDMAPKLVVRKDGSEWWFMDGWARENAGNLISWNAYDTTWAESRTYHNPDGSLKPGCGNASQRLREQDIDGLDAEVLYPPVYAGTLLRKMIEKDKEAYLSIVRSYNDFLAEEYCAVAPDRLIGNAMVPETGVDDAIAEMKRVKNKGLLGFCLTKWPNGGDYYKPEDDRFFAATIDLGIANSPHQGFGASSAPPSNGITVSSLVSNYQTPDRSPAYLMSQLILNGVFDRLPGLKLYFAESHAGWLGHYLNWSDEWYQRWYPYFEHPLKKLPSQYYRDHAKFSYISDRLATKYRYDIGLDLLMWGSDFPHSIGTSPYSRLYISEIFAGVPENEKRQILVENPCGFFGLDPNKDITPTPA